jgi:hypothetical protein
MTRDLQYDKSSVAMPGQPIPKTNEQTTVYRQNPGSINSPNAPGGEVKRDRFANNPLAKPALPTR